LLSKAADDCTISKSWRLYPAPSRKMPQWCHVAHTTVQSSAAAETCTMTGCCQQC